MLKRVFGPSLPRTSVNPKARAKLLRGPEPHDQ
jgi:hypothetical protein